jgi:hypothetical protein
MMLRLVLVGMVAALGISIPSQPSCEHWYDSAQAWATSLVAEWDNWEPSDDGTTRLVGTLNHVTCEECRLARVRLAVTAQASSLAAAPQPESNGTAKATDPTPNLAAKTALAHPKTSEPIAFEPIHVDDDFECGIAYELNRAADGLGDAEPPGRVSEARPPTPQPIVVADSAELGIWAELCRFVREPLAVPEESDASAAVGPLADAGERSTVCDIDGSSQTETIRAAGHSKSPNDGAGQSAKSIQETSSDELRISCFAEECGLDDFLEEIETAPRAIAKLPDLPTDVFAHAPVASALAEAPKANDAPKAAATPGAAGAPKIADAPKIAADTPRTASPPVLVDLPSDVFAHAPDLLARKPVSHDEPLAGSPPQPHRLGDAVELTRRAVSAWVSVLIGPALVDGSPR